MSTKFFKRLVSMFFVLPLFGVLLAPSVVNADGFYDYQIKLARKGDAQAQFKVGEMYETGFGVGRDSKEAKAWTLKSAEQGFTKAVYKSLVWDLEKNGLTDDNKARFEDIKSNAETGDHFAQYYLGKIYASGAGVGKDYNKAENFLGMAFSGGVSDAENELSAMREEKISSYIRVKEEKKKQAAKKKAAAKAKAKKQRELQASLQREQELKKKRKKKMLLDQKEKQRIAKHNKRIQKEKARIDKAKKEKELKNKELSEKIAAIENSRALAKKKIKENKKSFNINNCSSKASKFKSNCK